MPSFDIVSEVDMQEVINAVDQANREVKNRYDFKGTDSNFVLEESTITLHSSTDALLKQMLSVLRVKMGKRNIDVASLQVEKPITGGRDVRQVIQVKQGIEKEDAKKIVKMVKEMKIKVQAGIHEDKVKITGKKRDDLQSVMAKLKGAELDLPLQYENFRD